MAPARVQAGADDMDPAKLPPFALDIADLKFGKVVLGQAVTARCRVQGEVMGRRVLADCRL